MKNRQIFNLRLPRDVHWALRELASQHGVSMNEEICQRLVLSLQGHCIADVIREEFAKQRLHQ